MNNKVKELMNNAKVKRTATIIVGGLLFGAAVAATTIGIAAATGYIQEKVNPESFEAAVEAEANL